jgi:hypothetical protein
MDDEKTEEEGGGMDGRGEEEVDSFRDAGFSEELREPNTTRGRIDFLVNSEEITDFRGRNAEPSGTRFPGAGMEEVELKVGTSELKEGMLEGIPGGIGEEEERMKE